MILDDLDRVGGERRWNNKIVRTDEDTSSNELPTVELNDFRHDSIGIVGNEKDR